jgi:hypothetical protein
VTALRTRAAAALLLTVALVGCAAPTTDSATSTTAPLTTSDAVADAFSAAYAAGDTPLACTYASGDALKDLTVRDMCKHSPGWSSGYWSGEHCAITSGDFAGSNGYSYDTTNPVGSSQVRGFWLIVSGSGTHWTVSHVGDEDRRGWCTR